MPRGTKRKMGLWWNYFYARVNYEFTLYRKSIFFKSNLYWKENIRNILKWKVNIYFHFLEILYFDSYLDTSQKFLEYAFTTLLLPPLIKQKQKQPSKPFWKLSYRFHSSQPHAEPCLNKWNNTNVSFLIWKFFQSSG